MTRRVPIYAAVTVLATCAALLPPATAATPNSASAVPRLLGLSPGSGPVTGHNTIVVRGRGLDGVSSVSFGSASSSQITPLSKHRIGVVVPEHAAGTVQVRLHAGAHTSAANSARSGYRFVDPPRTIHFGPVEVIEPSDQTFFTDVSCAGPQWCLAVDFTGNAFTWSHGSWSGPQAVSQHQLVAVSCKPSRTCVAVGGGHAFMLHDGTWHKRLIDTGHELVDVSCAPHGLCAAVDDGGRVITKRLHHHWTAPEKINALRLTAISCPTQHTCVATGLAPDPSFANGIARVMRGSQWPAIAHTHLGRFYAVDCSSAHDCLILGDSGYVFWHGDTRSKRILPRHGGNEAVTVTCVGRTFCLGSARATDSDQDEVGGAYVLDGAATLHQTLAGAPIVSCVSGASGPVCVMVVGHAAAVGRP